MRTLHFVQITDSRFDNDLNIIYERIDRIKKLLNIEGVTVNVYDVYRVLFEDGTLQKRAEFTVRKDTRKVTWNDIYELVNSVKAVPYKFI